MRLLLAGGGEDPNLDSLHQAADELGIEVLSLRTHGSTVPSFHWDLGTREAFLDGNPLEVDAAFLRLDVFGLPRNSRPYASSNALGWYHAVQAWVHVTRVRSLNTDASYIAGFKPAVLSLAQERGLRIPRTYVTNQMETLQSRLREHVSKPVAGGGYCYALDEALAPFNAEVAALPMPAIVQPRLEAPEIRIYIIGTHSFAFEMRSESLDYRVKQDVAVIPIPTPADETGRLRHLMATLEMEFGAADFKTDPATGSLVFLELNTCPMFSRFDAESGGEICRAMLATLCPATPFGLTRIDLQSSARSAPTLEAVR